MLLVVLLKTWPNIWGNEAIKLEGTGPFGVGKGNWKGAVCWGTWGALWSWRGFGEWVKSRVTVGKGAEADIVAMLDEHGRIVLARKLGFISASPLGIDPERSMLAAAAVVEAIAMAAGGSGWL